MDKAIERYYGLLRSEGSPIRDIWWREIRLSDPIFFRVDENFKPIPLTFEQLIDEGMRF